MSIPKQLAKAIQRLYQKMWRLGQAITKKLMNWLLRGLIIIGRRRNLSRSGFVLPTVTMVILVVVLLTTAIVFRSFDRAKNASNVRVDQALLNAAAPAIERAKTKLDLLFADSRLPRGTPSETSLYSILSDPAGKKADQPDPKYTFGDETPLKLAYNLDSSSTIIDESNPGNNSLENWETISTAWRFPADTDNNGKFDSFTLYAINFRTPSRSPQTAAFTRERSPLDVRTPPQDDGIGSGECEAALTTSAKLVTQSGWYKSGSKLKKSFIVYTITVPITDLNAQGLIPANQKGKYENYQGGRGFSALEYQEDRARIPLSNNAVVFEDDLTITPGTTLQLNGRIMTNSNLFVTPSSSSGRVEVWQVSAPKSCYYQEENSKVLVGGNIVNYDPTGSVRANVPFDLFKPDITPTATALTQTNQSVGSTETAGNISYNNKAYTDRINYLVQKWVADNPTATQPGTGQGVPNNNDPDDVRDKVRDSLASDAERVRIEALTLWFEDRTRRVPFDEVAYDPTGATPAFSGINYQGTGNSLRPPKEWMFPVDPADGTTATGYSNLTLNLTSTAVQPPATEPETQKKRAEEVQLGDRILVGNNLPAKWYKLDNYADYNTNNEGIFVNDKEGQGIGTDTEWDTDENNPKEKPRKRFSRVTSLGDVGDKGRDGFWEKAAAQAPKDVLEGIGGLRVVTGAGVYLRSGSFLPAPNYQDPTSGANTATTYDDPNTTTVTETFPIVWPDTMPMSLDHITPARGDLKMRATAVYHYATDAIDAPGGTDQAQKPIACVSSYYDPSYYLVSGSTIYDSTKNLPGLPAWQSEPNSSDANGKSNNGITYKPGQTSANITAAIPDATTGLFPGNESASTSSFKLLLGNQANLVFPNGRFVNERLRDALQKSHNQRTLSEQAAIDSTLCALQILNGQISPDDTVIPHGAIKEVAFLDGREIQRIDADTGASLSSPIAAPIEPFLQTQNAGTYNLRIEDRQPLEIRATQLDLDLLRRRAITITEPKAVKPTDNKEYLLPNSGIIYATRDDALPDLSAPLPTTPGLTDEQKKAQQKENSPLDYRLDPTRRPNGIMLINGEKLARADSQQFRDVEKGLILATNLPAYIWKDFNLHTQGEFTQALANPVTRTSFYGRTTPNSQFACRPGDDRLPNCTTGDEWRPATVIADSVNLLSNSFRFGYRNEGDYDLRNNTGWIDTDKRLAQGFFDNNYVTNGLSSGNPALGASRDFVEIAYSEAVSNATNNRDSSYFNNFVTPVQRRGDFPEYVMEICQKLLVSECGDGDWVVGTAANPTLKASEIPRGTPATDLLSGTTAKPPKNFADQRFPRRVAFLRNPANNQLFWDSGNSNTPVPIGIDSNNKVQYYPYKNVIIKLKDDKYDPINGADTPIPAGLPDPEPNSLWFRASTASNNPTTGINYGPGNRLFYLNPLAPGQTNQPLLVPVLQLNVASGIAFNGTTNNSGNAVKDTNWLPRATPTTFNVIVAAGNTPLRPNEADGGLQNFPRFLENWNGVNAEIRGSLLEFSRSAYADSPFLTVASNPATAPHTAPTDPFGYLQLYKTDNAGGRTPYYTPPNRIWGYDVGLLSQLPDLFASRFTSPPAGQPDEFYREVSRDDEWVKTLLCGRIWNVNYQIANPAINTDQRPTDYCQNTTGRP
ncbi:MAG TPA: hypothetical protein DEG17_14590 [Cyanobacteria bacterium UBA11149]|nr:hypothetical protein [Cyanobacteria bacterium UBA11367]HBE60248.1 hypothetical protein [Cyanobacteria bacterium UBA11366]HBK66499.1 hypothetical protein [Cyanobacteria bacterium UBA11166]HBR76896.1 hypothetical protein [Cyanobacteria bacterium UBA11159]HBS70450.1 hypothetical protein [Cyanobacteria bacterium UBA11153]HBW90065.1 hypothetical protein [Cyanobacteria bacterium UBA11149]HCA94326.1 hypothetical protein [Cyanobacteria bacterium UBA9226]